MMNIINASINAKNKLNFYTLYKMSFKKRKSPEVGDKERTGLNKCKW